MSEVSAVSSIQATALQYQATLQLLEHTLEAQMQAMEQLLAEMGVGTKINIQA